MTTPVYSEHKPKRLPLRPSSAHRWLNCPGQPRVSLAASTAFGDRPNPYAAEGIAAHDWLEKRLTKQPLPTSELLNEEQLEVLEAAAQEIEDMVEFGGYELHVETKVEYRLGKTMMTGRIDILLVRDGHIFVIDYKHGMGIGVRVKGNPQLVLYALGALRKFPGRAVSVGILQPRGVGGGFDEWMIPPDELRAWVDTFEAAAHRCYQHRAEYTPGPWCQGCPGLSANMCPRLLADEIDAVAAMPGAGEPLGTEPPWWILDVESQLKTFIKGVADTADETLLNRGHVPGWMMEQTQGRSRWIEPDEVPAMLAEKLGGDESEYCTTTVKPIGITEAKRLAKKVRVDLDSMVERPVAMKRRRCDDDWEAVDTDDGFDPVE